MTEYEFTLTYHVPIRTDMDDYADIVAGVSDDDALISIEDDGRMILMYEREAVSADEAIKSAKEEVELALPEAKFVAAGPDDVGITDIADLLDVSRQYVRKIWLTTGLSEFPRPYCQGKSPRWHCASVIRWLIENNKINESYKTLLETAKSAMQVNFHNYMEDLDSVCMPEGSGSGGSSLKPYSQARKASTSAS